MEEESRKHRAMDTLLAILKLGLLARPSVVVFFVVFWSCSPAPMESGPTSMFCCGNLPLPHGLRWSSQG